MGHVTAREEVTSCCASLKAATRRSAAVGAPPTRPEWFTPGRQGRSNSTTSSAPERRSIIGAFEHCDLSAI